MWRAFKQLFPITLKIDTVLDEAGGDKSGLTAELLTDMVQENAQEAYDRREAELTPDLMREIERRVVLSVLDRKWREHLYEMDYLREGIGLRAMAQRDPLVEYQREGFDMFNTMMEGIKEESVAYLFNSKVDVQPSPIVEEAGGELPAASLAMGQVPGNGAPGGVIEDSVAPAGPAPVDGSPVDGSPVDGAPAQRSGRRGSGGRGSRGRHAKNGPAQPAAAQPPVDQRPAAGAPGVVTPGLSQPQRPARLSYSAPSVDGEAQVQRRAESTDGGEFGKVGRNAPCPCGSGRKYKLCHGDPRNRPAG
jgi:preprotein translocase subunit SecA